MVKAWGVMGALLVSLAGASAAVGNDSAPVHTNASGVVTGAVPGGGDRPVVPSARQTSASLKEIYSNFNSDREILYDMHTGLAVSSKESNLGSYLVGMPFTPAEDSNVRKIILAITHFRGTNSLNISLRADANGLPGDILARFVVNDMAEFGTCCETVVLHAEGIPVVAGTQYWVVARAVGDANNAWNINSLRMEGPVAHKHDAGWYITTDNVGAFRVLGD